jgi:hypothetical protein
LGNKIVKILMIDFDVGDFFEVVMFGRVLEEKWGGFKTVGLCAGILFVGWELLGGMIIKGELFMGEELGKR